MSRPTIATLAERRNDLSQRLILEAALQLLERTSITEVTARAVAKQAGVSERTVFRYFATREEVRKALALPPVPSSLEELLVLPSALYRAFEAKAELTKAALHTEVFNRMRLTQAKERWAAVTRLVDELAPRRAERERRIAAANIRFYLAATAWHYFRFYFGFNLEDSIAAAETAIRQTINGLQKRA
jgi:hypothetical protein